MLEYIKLILSKVSFDITLFEKELKKGLKTLESDELIQLKQWCYERFTDINLLVVIKVFQPRD